MSYKRYPPRMNCGTWTLFMMGLWGLVICLFWWLWL